MRLLSRILGALAIILVFFFGTLFVLNRYAPGDPVARDTKKLQNALQAYRNDHHLYPTIPEASPISDLKRQLIAGGYFHGIADSDKDTRYISLDGKSYGLLLYINRTATNPQGMQCLIEVDIQATGWWGQPPKCPF
jgi:hypothetical protein